MDGLIFHSDRGKQYTSKTFTILLEQYDVEQSVSASGSPHDNAAAETFLSRSKKKRRIAVNTPRNGAFAKAWRNMFNFTMRFGSTGF